VLLILAKIVYIVLIVDRRSHADSPLNPEIEHTNDTSAVAVREGELSAARAVIRAVPRPQLCLEPEALAYMFLEGVSNRPREGD
jgi:hypothetical protein